MAVLLKLSDQGVWERVRSCFEDKEETIALAMSCTAQSRVLHVANARRFFNGFGDHGKGFFAIKPAEPEGDKFDIYMTGVYDLMMMAKKKGMTRLQLRQALEAGLECSARGHPLLTTPETFCASTELRNIVFGRVLAFTRHDDRHGPLLPQDVLLRVCPICRELEAGDPRVTTAGMASLAQGVEPDVLLHCCRLVPVKCLGGNVEALTIPRKEIEIAILLWGKGRPASSPSLLDVSIEHIRANGPTILGGLGRCITASAGKSVKILTGLSMTAWLTRFQDVFRVEHGKTVHLRASPSTVPHTDISRRMTEYVRARLKNDSFTVMHSVIRHHTFSMPRQLVRINPEFFLDQAEIRATQHHLILLQAQGVAQLDVPLSIIIVMEYLSSKPAFSALLYLDSAAHLFQPLETCPHFRQANSTFIDAYLSSMPGRGMHMLQLCVQAPPYGLVRIRHSQLHVDPMSCLADYRCRACLLTSNRST